MRALPAVLAAAVVLAGTVPLATVPVYGTTASHSPATVDGDGASLVRVGTWQAPTSGTDFDGAADVRTAIGERVLSRATGVTPNHTLVVGIELHGFGAAVANAEGSNGTERFLSAMTEHGDLTVAQTDHGRNQRPAFVHVLEGDGVRVFPDSANDTYYLAIDLAAANVTRGEDGPAADLEYGAYRFTVTAELAADSDLTDDRQRAVAAVAPRSATVETAPDGRIHLQPHPDQTVAGTTNVGTGWNVTVVVAGEDDPDTAADESFVLTPTATVEAADDGSYRERGSFQATLDLRDVRTSARNVTVDVRFDGRSLLDEPVPARVATRTAAVEANGVVDDGVTGVAATADLSTGGFLVLHAGTADGQVVGHSAYLEPGERSVTVYLDGPTDAEEVVVVVHRDANYNEWFDGPDADPAYVHDEPTSRIDLGLAPSPPSTASTATRTVDGAAATSPTSRPPGSASAAASPASRTTGPSGSPGSQPAGTSAPGFVGVSATVAIVIAIGLFRRRRSDSGEPSGSDDGL